MKNQNARAHDEKTLLILSIKETRDEACKTRLRAVLGRITGKTKHEVAESLVVSTRSVDRWYVSYKKSGIKSLRTKKSGRRKGDVIWSADIFESLTKEIDKGEYWSVPRMMKWIKDNHGVNIPEQTVWYRISQIGYSYKSARPNPYKGDKEKQDDFKKRGLLKH